MQRDKKQRGLDNTLILEKNVNIINHEISNRSIMYDKKNTNGKKWEILAHNNQRYILGSMNE